MGRYIIIKVPHWSADANAEDFAADINRTFQPHYDAEVVEIDARTSAYIDSKLENDRIQDLLDKDMI